MNRSHTGWNRLVGHDWVLELLRGAIQHDRAGHAYLFTGPEQIGKTTAARLFAQALNCTAPLADRRPCGECRSCQLIATDRHPDVRLVEPEKSARGRRTLKIEEIRDLQKGLSLSAVEARYKIAIITYFDAATTGATNAFLKTLEEPPPNVKLLLTATDADGLLPTITSRCRVLNLRPLAAKQIARALEKRYSAAPGMAEELAHMADGRLGWAIRAIEQPELLEARDSSLQQLEALLEGRRVARFTVAEQLAQTPEALPDQLRVWLTWWRDLALLAHGGNEGALTNIRRRDRLEQLARIWEADAIVRALKQTEEALRQLEQNANTRLVLEVLFLAYPYLSERETVV